MNLDAVRRNDPLVASLLNSGTSLEEVICHMSARHDTLIGKLETLYGITPKKVKLTDGMTVVWHCPDELVPEMEVLIDE